MVVGMAVADMADMDAVDAVDAMDVVVKDAVASKSFKATVALSMPKVRQAYRTGTNNPAAPEPTRHAQQPPH
jgi:hypothetical protein